MTEHEPSERPLPRVKGRLPFEAPGAKRPSLKPSSLVLYAIIVAALLGLALYMAIVERMPVLSPWVAAPAIGSLWFMLRLFMIWGSRG